MKYTHYAFLIVLFMRICPIGAAGVQQVIRQRSHTQPRLGQPLLPHSQWHSKPNIIADLDHPKAVFIPDMIASRTLPRTHSLPQRTADTQTRAAKRIALTKTWQPRKITILTSPRCIAGDSTWESPCIKHSPLSAVASMPNAADIELGSPRNRRPAAPSHAVAASADTEKTFKDMSENTFMDVTNSSLLVKVTSDTVKESDDRADEEWVKIDTAVEMEPSITTPEKKSTDKDLADPSFARRVSQRVLGIFC